MDIDAICFRPCMSSYCAKMEWTVRLRKALDFSAVYESVFPSCIHTPRSMTASMAMVWRVVGHRTLLSAEKCLDRIGSGSVRKQETKKNCPTGLRTAGWTGKGESRLTTLLYDLIFQSLGCVLFVSGLARGGTCATMHTGKNMAALLDFFCLHFPPICTMRHIIPSKPASQESKGNRVQ